MTFNGTTGDDRLLGTNAGDGFDVSQGGNDAVFGKGADDVVRFNDTFTASDFVDGGGGDDDAILLWGNYFGGVDIGSATIRNVENITMFDGFDYRLTFEDSAVAAGRQMSIDAGALGTTSHLILDATAETGSSYVIFSGAGGDTVSTGGGDDTIKTFDGTDFIIPGLGHDTIDAGDGGDTIEMLGNGALDAHDRLDGGAGVDSLVLFGDYSAGLAFTAAMMKNVEFLTLAGGADYTLDLTHLSAPAAGSFTVYGAHLNATDILIVDASGLNVYDTLVLDGGAADDTLTAGRFADTLLGNGGADRLKGGPGSDVYGYGVAADSLGANYDTIVGFDAHADALHTFSWLGNASGVDPMVHAGRLSTAHFEEDLSKHVTASELAAAHVVLYEARHGNLAGELFLVIDANNTAGFQVGEDMVIHLFAPKHVDDLSSSNFASI